MVSGSHFFPKAPLLWVKWIPACEVMSRKVMVCADPTSAEVSRKSNTRKKDIEVQGSALPKEASFSL